MNRGRGVHIKRDVAQWSSTFLIKRRFMVRFHSSRRIFKGNKKWMVAGVGEPGLTVDQVHIVKGFESSTIHLLCNRVTETGCSAAW